MAIHNLIKKTRASTGQRIVTLGSPDNTARVNQLENRISDHAKKLDQILELLKNGNNLPSTNQ